MSTFDNPFDAKRGLNQSGCSCGQHASQAEHDAQPALQAVLPSQSEEKAYENIVASAVMRQLFPQDAGRRAFCVA